MPPSVGLEVLGFSFPGALFGHSSGRYYQALELLSLGSVLVLSSRGVVGRSAINDSTVPLEVVGHCILGFFRHFGVLVRVSGSGILSRVTPLYVGRQGANGDDVVDSKSRRYNMLCPALVQWPSQKGWAVELARDRGGSPCGYTFSGVVSRQPRLDRTGARRCLESESQRGW